MLISQIWDGFSLAVLRSGQASHHDLQQRSTRRRTLVQLTPQGEEMPGYLIGYPGNINTVVERLSALSAEELTVCVQGISILIRVLTHEPALLSFPSHLTERIRPSKSEEPGSQA